MSPHRKTSCIELTIPSSPDYLSLVRSSVRWYCQRCRLSEKETDEVVLSVVEAVTNIIRHAYQGRPDGKITLLFRELPGGIELEFLDEGRAVSAQSLRGKEPDDLEAGGLGVHIMKCCMDAFAYEKRPEGGARLVLRKLARGGPPASPDGERGSSGGSSSEADEEAGE